MPSEDSPRSPKSPETALGITRFPSADLWEDPWEPNFDLRALRRRAGKLDAAYRFARRLRPDVVLPGPSRDGIELLVSPLALGQEPSTTLANDGCLIARWYNLPVLSQSLRIGREAEISQLARAGQYADTLYTLIGGIAPTTEQLAEDLNEPLPMVTAENSLMGFADHIGALGHAVRNILKVVKPARRPAQYRRNLAIVLVSHAVEDATKLQIATSRDTKNRGGEHFANAPGRFIADFMRLLTRSNESAVAGTFVDLRREPSR